MERLVLASGNEGKIEELSSVLSPIGIAVIPITNYYPEWSVAETGDTFFANARLKAVAAMQTTGLPSLADDSGLSVNYLGGEPGVNSRFFAGEHATTAENNALLLVKMRTAKGRRHAHFTSVLALALPGGEVKFAVGRLFGSITEEPRGQSGFGYDPLFLVRGMDKTLAELTIAEKNKISHRGRAISNLLAMLSHA